MSSQPAFRGRQPDQTLNQLCYAVVENLNAHRVCIWLLDDDKDSVTLFTSASSESHGGKAKSSNWRNFPVANFPLAGTLFSSVEGVLIQSAQDDPSLPHGLAEDLNLSSLCAVPLHTSEGAVGFATIEPARPTMCEEIASVLPLISSAAGHAQQWRSTESRRALGELLLELSEAAMSQQTLEQVLDTVCFQLSRRLGVRGTLVLLLDNGRLVPYRACLADPIADSKRWDAVTSIKDPLPLADAALSAGVSVTAEGPTSSLIGPRWAVALDSGPVVAVPISGTTGSVGVFVFDLGRRPGLTEGELRLASAAAVHLSRTIGDVRSAEEAGLRLRVATAVSELLQAGTDTTSVPEALNAIARVVQRATQVSASVVVLISPDNRVDLVRTYGLSSSSNSVLDRHLKGMPASELALWDSLTKGAKSGFAITSDSTPQSHSSIASLLGLASWAEAGLWVKEELRAVVVCGDPQPDRIWLASERDVLCQLALEGALVLAHAELRQAEAHRLVEMAHRALHDPLTGLANRELFGDRLERSLARTDRHPAKVAVLFVDLDRFKAINDTFGHQIGDELLRQTAARLSECLRPQDTVARFGGDEFTVLLDEINGSDEAERAAERIIEQLRQPFDVFGRRIQTTGSVGIAMSEERIAAADLLRKADMAMYRAKQGGRNQWELYEASDPYATSPFSALPYSTSDAHDSRSALERAMSKNELEVWLQPVVAFEMGRALEWEVLLRWNHPDRGLLTAQSFLAQAEQASLLHQIDWWVLREATATLGRWHVAWGDKAPYLSVNVSRSLLQDGSMPDRISHLLGSSGAPSNSLILEVSEKVLSQADDPTWEAIGRLRRLGVKHCLDHFGTDSTSFSVLAEQKFYELKVDRHLLMSEAKDARLGPLKAALALAEAVGSPLCAVGLETAAQMRFVQGVGLPLGQGDLLGSPIPLRKVEQALAGTMGSLPAPREDG